MDTSNIHSEASPIASTILFVDDEAQELKYFTRALRHNFTIKTANSVDEAISTLKKHHKEIAIVISDQRMPIKHGMELLRYTHKHYAHIIRMLTTAHCDLSSSIDAINQAEVFRYIAKPWNLDDLNTSLNQALTRYAANIQALQTPTNAEQILKEFEEDCEHWLMYALHAYGDITIYKGGLEALSCKYTVKLHKELHSEHEIQRASENINKILQDNYLNDTVILDMQIQSNKGFGITDEPHNKNH